MKIFRNSIKGLEPCFSDSYKLSVWNITIPYGDSIICFNSLSGSLVLLEKTEYEVTSNIEEKLKLGIIVPEDSNEREEWNIKYQKAKRDDSLLDLTIVVSRNCQLRCSYCFEGVKENRSMTSDTIQKIKSYVASKAGRLKLLRVTWFGGEPLMHMASIQELSEYFQELCQMYGIKYIADITTNGVGLSLQVIQTLVDKCKVRRYIITIDGTKDVHDKRRYFPNGQGSFDIIWKNINALIQKDVRLTIRVTIDKENVDNVREFIDYISENITSDHIDLVFVRTHDYSFTPDEIKSSVFSSKQFASIETDLITYAVNKGIGYIPLPHHSPLGGCLREADIVIGTDGEVYRCLDTIGEHKWITGSISDVEKPQWYKEWLAWNPKDWKCKTCSLLPLCSGGCPHNALFTDKKHGTDEQCPDWKFNYKELIKLYVDKKLELNDYAEV